MIDALVEMAEKQEAIIRMQSEIINELLRLLALYMASDELDNLDAVKKISMAAQLKNY